MCVNKYYVVNPYVRKGLYVNCGKCPACLQEKAIRRVRRIKDTYSDNLDCLMVTLTYSRRTAPYIDRSEAFHFSHGRVPCLHVYRDSSYRRLRVGSSYDFEYRKISDDRVVLDSVPFVSQQDFAKLKDLKHENGKIGVCHYKDLQQFVARLRLNLKRNYSYDKEFKTFSCSEYGTKSLRPHFHMLLFCNKGDTEVLRSAIIESWPFSDLSKFDRAVERCFRGASYVASYVNSPSGFPSFLKTYFKPKHSYSKGFGLGNQNFTLQNIIDCFYKGSFTYPVVKAEKVQTQVINKLIPKYVIHRYFPKFVGYSRIAPTSLYDVMQGLGRGEYDAVNEMIKPLYYSNDDGYKIAVRLHNAFKRCNDELPLVFGTFEEYYKTHIQVWNLYNSNLLRLSMEDSSVPLNQKYDNLDVVINRCRNEGTLLPVGFSENDFLITDPNKFSVNVLRTEKLTSDFAENIKHRSVTNVVLSSLYEEF